MEDLVGFLGIAFGMVMLHVVSDWWHGRGKPALTESPKQVASRWTPTAYAVVGIGIILLLIVMALMSSSGCTGWEARAMTC